MGQRLKVAERKDIPDGEGISVMVGRDPVALVNDKGVIFAVSDVCPHAGGPLSQGWVEEGQVTCPWHGWTFPLHEDCCKPHNDGLLRYKVITEGEDIYIELPD